MPEEFSNPSSSHPWAHLEPDWRRLLCNQSANDCTTTPEEALKKVLPYALASARGLLAERGASNPEHDAANAVQELCCAILNGGTAPREGKPAHLYAFGMLRNICRNLVKRQRRMKPWPDGFEPSDGRFDPSQQAMQREAERIVGWSMDALSDPMRETLRSQFFEGLSAREAAKREGISEGAINNRRYRARRRIRDDLHRYFGPEW